MDKTGFIGAEEVVGFGRAVDIAFPRRRDKALFYLLFVLGGMPGVQLAFALTHRNRKWV